MHYRFNNQDYSVHDIVLQRICSQSNILEVGCCTGYISKKLVEKGCVVWGVDNNEEYLKKAKKYCEKTFLINLENTTEFRLIHNGEFDYILLMDVLEHLKNPKNLLSFINTSLIVNKDIIISLPNVANISIRTKLLIGKFEYEESGLLDKTHFRFYTLLTGTNLIKSSGLKIKTVLHTADLGLVPLLGRFLKRLPKGIQYLVTKISPTLLAGQFIFICSK